MSTKKEDTASIVGAVAASTMLNSSEMAGKMIPASLLADRFV